MATVHERSRGRVPPVPQLADRQRVLCLAPPGNAMKKYRVTSLLSIPRRIGKVGWGGSMRAPNAVAACRAVAAIWRRIVRASCPIAPGSVSRVRTCAKAVLESWGLRKARCESVSP